MMRILPALFFISLVVLSTCSPAAVATVVEGSQTSQDIGATETEEEPGIEISEEEYAAARASMVDFGLLSYGISDEAVIEVMGRVPRHEFVQDQHRHLAYANHPLPIGYGQTISQPFIVALMTQELGVEAGDKVLEIGTGSGYQAAILAELDLEVYTIEIINELALEVQDRFLRLGYDEIQVRNADGYYGWSEHAPFDAIIVTAAPDHVPQPLIEQLAVGGVMVIPVGPIGGIQELWRIEKTSEEAIQSSSLGGVRFVPFTRTGKPSDINTSEW